MCFQTSKTSSSASVVSDPRLASLPPITSASGCLSSSEPTAAGSSFPVTTQILSGSVMCSGPFHQPQTSQISPFQLVSSPPLLEVAPLQPTQIAQSNGNFPQWLHDASLPTTAPGTAVDVASCSGTTNSLQTPIISSQLHGSQTPITTVVSSILGSQPLLLNTNAQVGVLSQPTTLPGILPPPPPNVHPSIGVPPLSSFVAAAMPPYTIMSGASSIPYPPNSFTVPPPAHVVVSPPNLLNISPPTAVNCPMRGSFYNYSSVSPVASCTLSSPLPSISASTALASASGVVSRRPLANGSDSNSNVDSPKVNGDSRHESRKHFDNCGTAPDSRGDRRSFGRFRGGDDIGRGGLRDPRGHDRDRERSGNRGLQHQLHNNGGRRYSSDNRNRMPRYRDYGDDRRSRRYDSPYDDFSRNRR